MYPSLKPSQRVAIIGTVDPQSASTVKTTAWVDMKLIQNAMAVVGVGALGASATVDAKLQQAKDNAGTGAKDIAGKAIVQLTKAAANDSSQQLINVKQDDLDVTNNFEFIQLQITPAVAASLIEGLLLGFDHRFLPADANAAATQTQVVG